MTQKRIVGVIGAGIRGLELMQAVLNVGGNVAVVCDLYDGHFRRAQEIQPNTPTTREYREVVDRKDIDAVLIATHDPIHAEATIASIESGKHVYCEKPLTRYLDEAGQMEAAVREHGWDGKWFLRAYDHFGQKIGQTVLRVLSLTFPRGLHQLQQI